MKAWFWNVLIAFDQLFNAILGGDPDETISSRVAKRIKAGRAAKYEVALGKALDWVDPGHMHNSIESDEGDDAVSK